MHLTIDKEFSDLLPPLSDHERSCLELSIRKHGRVLDPIKVWGNIIVDGEHRYEIATRNGFPYTINELEFESRQEAKEWIARNQLGRRNIDSIVRANLVAKIRNGRTVSETAKETKVSPRTAFRDLETNKAIESLPRPAKDKITSGKVEASRASIKKLDSLPPEVKEQVVDVIAHGNVSNVNDAISIVNTFSKKTIDVPKSIKKSEDEFLSLCEKMARLIDDRSATLKDEALGHKEKCHAFLRTLRSHWESWIREYK